MNDLARQQLKSLKLWLCGGVVLAIALAIPAGIFWPRQLLTAYLAAILWSWSLSIGSLGFLLVFTLTGGKWGRAAWPWMATSARMFPLVGVLFVPWAFGLWHVYPWTNPEIFAGLENMSHREWLYQVPFYLGRTVFYFLIWSGLAWLATGPLWQFPIIRKYEPLAERRTTGGEAVGGLGLVVILLSMTWAGFDWVMSLDPFFSSTLFGALIGIGAMLSAMAATIVGVCLLPSLQRVEAPVDREKSLGDLSNLLLAFVMLWAYFQFAHYLIMWEGNLPVDAEFYAVRMRGMWGWIGPGLAVAGFIIPFLCLLNYEFKRTPRKVGWLALFLLFIRLIELDWFVMPSAAQAGEPWGNWAIVPASMGVVCLYSLGLLYFTEWDLPGDDSHVAGAVPLPEPSPQVAP